MSTTDGHDHHEERLWRRFAAAMDARAGDPTGCPDLGPFLDGHASETESDAVEMHLADCAECRAAVELVRSMTAQATMSPPQVLAAARALVAGAPGAEGPAGSMRLVDWIAVRRAAGWSVAAAASVAVCLVGYRVGAGLPGAAGPVDGLSIGVFALDDPIRPQLQILLASNEGVAP